MQELGIKTISKRDCYKHGNSRRESLVARDLLGISKSEDSETKNNIC